MTLEWILSILVAFLAGHYLGWILGRRMGFHRGWIKAHEWIEQASGMRDPVCICATDPMHCLHHVIYESKKEGAD